MGSVEAEDQGPSWRRWAPWEGRASAADHVVIVSVLAVIALGLATRPLLPFLIARNPLALEVLTGDLFAVGVAAAFARVGTLPLWAVIVAGVVGMLKFDWILWWAGRRWGEGMLRMISAPQQAARWSLRARRAHPAIVRTAVALAWLPGIPSAIVFAIAGLSGMRLMTFLLIDALGALVLTVVVAGLGFAVGQGAVDVVLIVDRYASAVSLSLILLAITIPLVRTALQGRHRRNRPQTQDDPGSTHPDAAA
ncbi:DedA family protein [Arthrobacter agilis]|uniref:DedA family protein n=1 Tax=Arthrobacter agilis TaxID=37921 RepID=UPI0027864984|nr:VTT domain-containing protein [Arthrobacter agilis]MDQ0734813.1 membrane protein DedA with SNARE-associated domain [Arthrobacter agilis]